MINNNLSDIVKVTIEIEEPVSNSASFNYALLVGPQPDIYDYSKAKPVKNCYTCTSYAEVVNVIKEICGITDSSGKVLDYFDMETLGDIPVLDAARVAFAQDPGPAKVFLAFNQFTDRDVTDAKITLIKSAADLPDGVTGLEATYPKLLVEYEAADTADETVVVTKNGSALEDASTSVANVGVFVEIGTGTAAAGDYTVSIKGKTSEFKADFTVANVGTAQDPSMGFGVSPGYGYATYLDDNGNSVTTRVAEYYERTRKSIESTISEANYTAGWYVVCPCYTDPNLIYQINDAVSSMKKILSYPVFGDVEDTTYNKGNTVEISGTPTTITKYSTNDLITNKSIRAFGIYGGTYYGQTAEELAASADKDNRYIHVAWAAKCLNYIPGSETWALKKLVGIKPCELSSTYMRSIKGEDQARSTYGANCSYYTTYADRDITQGGKVAYGEWIDVIRFRDWLENDMQIRIFNVLAKNRKVPYTDEGIALIKNQMVASLKQGQVNGGIAPTEFDEDENEIPGFVVTVPLAANITDIQKKSRVLTDCKFRARLAGAIHVVEVDGVLAYSLD